MEHAPRDALLDNAESRLHRCERRSGLCVTVRLKGPQNEGLPRHPGWATPTAGRRLVRCHSEGTMPARNAQSAAWVRDGSFSLRKMLLTCVRAVRSVMNSAFAIS